METNMDILQVVAMGNQKPTHIMYRANLCWERLKKHLAFLCDQELVRAAETPQGTRYELTERGREVLGYFRKLEGAVYYRRAALPSRVTVHYR